MFGSIMTTMIETFDECYAPVTEAAATATIVAVVVARPQGGHSLLYREFNNTKPPKFGGT